jgi:hypothetical protein
MSDEGATRTAWHDWWFGGANRSFTELLAEHGCDHRYGPPLLTRLREGATIVALQTLIGDLNAEFGAPRDLAHEHGLAVRLAVWWDTNRPFDAADD